MNINAKGPSEFFEKAFTNYLGGLPSEAVLLQHEINLHMSVGKYFRCPNLN